MKCIRYAEVTLKITIPVYSHTAEEAQAVALDQLADFVSHWDAADWEKTFKGWPKLLVKKPAHVANDALVWGDGVPEDHCTVEKLTRHLAER